jgi:hypothetical protein
MHVTDDGGAGEDVITDDWRERRSGGSDDHGENNRNVHHPVKWRRAGRATGERIPMSNRSPSIATAHSDHHQEGTVGVRTAGQDQSSRFRGKVSSESHPQRGGKGT